MHCIAYGCYNNSQKGCSMRRFPSDPIRKAIWVAVVNRKNWFPSPHSRLCDAHFEADQFEKPDVDGKVKLKRNAVPTVFVHEPIPKRRKCPSARSPVSKKAETERADESKNGSESKMINIHNKAQDSTLVIHLKRRIRGLIETQKRLRLRLSAMERKFQKLVRKDQINALKQKKFQRVTLSKETMKEALLLKLSSGYECLLQKSLEGTDQSNLKSSRNSPEHIY